MGKGAAMEMEEQHSFSCPYCMAENSISLDASGGRRQSFITDCEICCRPITVEFEIEADGYINFVAKQGSE